MPRAAHGEQRAQRAAWRSTTSSAKRPQPGAGRYQPPRCRPTNSQHGVDQSRRGRPTAPARRGRTAARRRAFIACVSDQHDDGDRHRRAHVLARVEAGREDLDADQAEQADAVAAQRAARVLATVEGVEAGRAGTASRRSGSGKTSSAAAHGSASSERQAQAPVEHARVGGGVAARLRRRQLRDQHRAERRRRAARSGTPSGGRRRSSHETGADALVRGDLGVDQDRDLRHRDAEQRRRHLPQHAAHAGVAPGRAERAQAEARCAAGSRCRAAPGPAPRAAARRRASRRRRARRSRSMPARANTGDEQPDARRSWPG